MQVLVVDPHPVIHLGLDNILAGVFPSHDMRVAHNGSEALKILGARSVDLVVIEIMLPDRDGLDIIRRMRHQGIKAPVLVFTVVDEARYALAALRAGAQGILHKSAPGELLRSALALVAGGRRFLSDEVLGELALEFEAGDRHSGVLSLTDREREVFIKLALGESVTSIADKLCIAYKTAYTHRVHILKKLKANGMEDLTRYAFENGMIPSRRVVENGTRPL